MTTSISSEAQKIMDGQTDKVNYRPNVHSSLKREKKLEAKGYKKKMIGNPETF